ncbi:MAG: KpsF/GutQ family sugar-phosphate isomerase, partial [Leptotrichiaceae bacterium]|nr:KpsF/GutQ family sugar-phosphate isomerase [Leptotrichiaceae bacterium]
MANVNILKEAKNVFDIEINELEKLKNKIDERFTELAKMIIETTNNKNKIVIAGIGKSGIIGKKMAATLSSTGTTTIFMNAAEAI